MNLAHAVPMCVVEACREEREAAIQRKAAEMREGIRLFEAALYAPLPDFSRPSALVGLAGLTSTH